MRTLVAGLGNVFESDDGFGVAVVAALTDAALPAGAEVRDFGIRGVHLAYQLLDDYDLVVIVDAVQRGDAPGTVYVIDHAADVDRLQPAGDVPMLDAHDLAPDEVLALVPLLGGALCRVVVVGCEPASVAPGMELSDAVARSVEKAAQLVITIVQSAYADADAPADQVRIGGGER
ncbi:MAG: hybD [Pseudonocardiales bacterium]|nr:hybD [Pseudonocardiales bacterium]